MAHWCCQLAVSILATAVKNGLPPSDHSRLATTTLRAFSTSGAARESRQDGAVPIWEQFLSSLQGAALADSYQFNVALRLALESQAWVRAEPDASAQLEGTVRRWLDEMQLAGWCSHCVRTCTRLHGLS
jgi:hypothetical protein